jgi:glycolate oxidase FAD binding subunit
LPSVSSLAEASALLAAATAAGQHVRVGEDLTLDGMTAVLEHEAGDLTCTVEAGIRLSALRAELAPRGQRLALDPPGDPTVGACLAANLSGPLRHRFGGPRDLVLGVTLVLGDGTVCNAGGKVVKNVAGYDLGKLVCGSEGKLALIARVSLRLHPVPAATRTLVVEADDPAATVRALFRSHLQPSAVDVLHPGRVVVQFEGSARAVAAQAAAAAALLRAAEADASVWDEARERQAAALGRLRFVQRDLGNTLSTLTEAVVRPSAGVAYVPRRVSDVLPAGVRRLNAAVKTVLDPAGTLV